MSKTLTKAEPKIQVFAYMGFAKGLFHDRQCTRVKHEDWRWNLLSHVTCLYRVSGAPRLQTWNREPKFWNPQPLPDDAQLCRAPGHLEHVFALQKDGRWLPWDGRSPAYGFSGNHKAGIPVGGYLDQSWRNSTADTIKRMVMDFTCMLHSCANGQPLKLWKEP